MRSRWEVDTLVEYREELWRVFTLMECHEGVVGSRYTHEVP